MKRLLILWIFSICYILNVTAQTIPVGSPQEDQLRRKQLLNEIPASSFSLRAITADVFDEEDSLMRTEGFTPKIRPLHFSRKGLVRLLPITWKQKLNTAFPYGINDGAMIPAKGYQTSFAAGIYSTIGPLSIQLQPEYVYARNNYFSGFSNGKSDQDLIDYYKFYNFVDAPERFGANPYSKLFWGQSHLTLTFDPVSLAFSTENLWWGPGIQNSLLLANNAPGFKHISLKTIRPVRTKIGAFEAEILGGRLKNSGFSPLLKTVTSKGNDLILPLRNESRYLSGLNINYQPRYLDGLTLGFIRTFIAYSSDINGLSDYLPFFVKLQKETGDQDQYDRDQRIGLYARWLFQKVNAEVYFEYGLNDNAYNFRDFAGSPDHGRSYLFGINKLFSLRSRNDEQIQINIEVTQLSQSSDWFVRDAGGFYQHFQVRQGYTHRGQVLGSGSGTGGNFQTLQANWVKGYKKLGFGIERLEHNMDFYDMFIKDYKGMNRKWVDFAFALQGQWDYKNLILNTKLQAVQSLNYQWYMKDYQPNTFYVPNNDVFNFHVELGISYRF